MENLIISMECKTVTTAKASMKISNQRVTEERELHPNYRHTIRKMPQQIQTDVSIGIRRNRSMKKQSQQEEKEEETRRRRDKKKKKQKMK